MRYRWNYIRSKSGSWKVRGGFRSINSKANTVLEVVKVRMGYIGAAREVPSTSIATITRPTDASGRLASVQA
ncbi:MAG: hypothetical protein QW220_06040 [Candidatus Bathyarchaeia archaeon]